MEKSSVSQDDNGWRLRGGALVCFSGGPLRPADSLDLIGGEELIMVIDTKNKE